MKNKLVIIFLFFIQLFIFNCGQNSQDNDDYKYTSDYEVSFQAQSKRTFRDLDIVKTTEIHFEELDSMVYDPGYCVVSRKGEIFIIDFSTYLLHKFKIKDSELHHKVFGNGDGHGPGEFIGAVPDFKVYKDKLYIAQPQRLSIMVFSTAGKYIRDIPFDRHGEAGVMPEKFAVLSENDIVVITRGVKKKNALYTRIDSLGNIVSTFGSYLYGSSEGGDVLHYSNLRRSDDTSFYCYESNLNCAGLFVKDELSFVKTGIDGIPDTKADIEQETHKNESLTITGVKNRKIVIRPIVDCPSKNMVIVKCHHIKEKQVYYDVYKRDDFSYLCSLNNFPKTHYYCMNGDTLYCANDYTLSIYAINFDSIL